jgi:hypothetical protein
MSQQPGTSGEAFPEWLARQIVAVKAQYDAIKTPARRRRHWDAYLLLKGVQEEYDRRTAVIEVRDAPRPRAPGIDPIDPQGARREP